MPQLDIQQLTTALRGYARLLDEHEARLNDLNVFPVPDGDTGTNLRLSLVAVLPALDAEPVASATRIDEVAPTLCRTVQLAARGTSGVIVAEALRGLLQTLVSPPPGASPLRAALEAAARSARQAVAEPVEGTVLSVAQAATAAEGDDAAALLAAAADRAWEAVAATPTQLAVLARASVVDAGGVGYALLLEALALAAGAERQDTIDPATWYLDDRPHRAARPAHPEQPAPRAAVPATPPARPPAGPDPDEHHRDSHEVILTLEATADEAEHLRRRWRELGSGVVVAGGDGLYRAHAHTSAVAAGVAAARAAGTVAALEITDLRLGGHEAAWVRAVAADLDGAEQTRRAPAAVLVAVLGSPTAAPLAAEAGVDRVVATEADRSPATEQVVAAAAGAPGEAVVLLPDGKDTRAVARLAASLVDDRRVEVVAVGSALEIVEVVRGLDRDTAVDRLLADLDQGAARVAGARIQPVSRPAVTDRGAVEPGDWLARGQGGVLAAGGALPEVVTSTAAALLASQGPGARLLVLWGGGLDDADFVATTDRLFRRWPELDVEVTVTDPRDTEAHLVVAVDTG